MHHSAPIILAAGLALLPPLAGHASPAGLAAADVNGDGSLSRAEFDARKKAIFTRLDRDGNGILTAPELARLQRRAPASMQAELTAADGNGDGSITREEFIARAPLFEKGDTNHDGTLSPAELDKLSKASRP